MKTTELLSLKVVNSATPDLTVPEADPDQTAPSGSDQRVPCLLRPTCSNIQNFYGNYLNDNSGCRLYTIGVCYHMYIITVKTLQVKNFFIFI